MPNPAVADASRAPSAAAQTFTIGELAREFALTTRTIRFYEDRGLLSPLRSGRQRIYSARDRARLKLTLRGKRLGLTLSEVKELVDMYESPRDNAAQLRRFLGVLAEHRSQIEQRMRDLQLTLAEVRSSESEAQRLLSREPSPPNPSRRRHDPARPELPAR